MQSSNRLTPFARALRVFSVWAFFVLIASLVLVICSTDFWSLSLHVRRETSNMRTKEGRPTIQEDVVSSMRLGEQFSRRVKDTERHSVEPSNLTVILEHLEVDSKSPDAPWMFTYSDSPFEEQKSSSAYANTKISWNSDGRGNGTCASGGSGRVSRGYLDPYNYYLGLPNPPDFDGTSVEMHDLSLSDFFHINTANSTGLWSTLGEAGDTRRYNQGRFEIFTKDNVLLSSKNMQWVQNISYPSPLGEAHHGTLSIGAYFIAEIEPFKSDSDWVHQLDPNGVGYVLGILTAASFGPISCFSSNSYWLSLRGFPDFSDSSNQSAAGLPVLGSGRSGKKVGIYKGSSERALATARVLAATAKAVVLTVVGTTAAGAVAAAGVAAVFPSAVQGPPGQGLVRLLGTTAFVAKVNEIHGFHSDAMNEFGNGLKIFIGKIEWPFAGGMESSYRSSASAELLIEEREVLLENASRALSSIVREEANSENVSISDELFGGCAFYTSLIVISFLSLHGVIWLCTRKKPWQEQLIPHAWMIYLFSVVMSHVYRAAVLNSMQYLRSHVGAGTGKAGLYAVAVIQLILIGIGFTGFFVGVMVLAMKRVRRQEVKWVPKEEIADPDTRQSALITGEYQAEEENSFHVLFECYYSSLAGPRVWLSALELGIVFLDAIFTAVIWNEVVCLAILVCLYALLFALFLLLVPFVDKVEGLLVVFLGLVEFVLLVMDFLGALGDYDAAENMEFGALILGFVGIGLAVLIAIYCDLIPIVCGLWCAARARLKGDIIVDSNSREDSTNAGSEWSGLSYSNSGTNESLRRFGDGEDHNFEREVVGVEGLSEGQGRYREREKEVHELLSSMFDQGVGQVGRDERNGSSDSRVAVNSDAASLPATSYDVKGEVENSSRGAAETSTAPAVPRQMDKEEIGTDMGSFGRAK